jgi:hypothetical protein
MSHRQKTVLESVSNAELVFFRILRLLHIIINDRLHTVMLMAQTILAFASSMAVVSNKTLKQLQNVTNLHAIMVILKVI